MVSTASFGSMRWDPLYHRQNLNGLTFKQLRQTKLADMFNFDMYTDEELLKQYESVVYRSTMQM